ncbi:uncharacterized protein LOC107797485 [Nicotiana tabacum]|uniref:Uncharacterized protein LOC107797485 n=1 Tax=Nicotiana tabacum TaxID=4097 RepID=A0AC58UI51_TOBAC
MKRYYPTTSKIPKSSSTSQDLSNLEEIANESKQHQQSERVNLGSLEVDPGERLAIRKYHPNDRDAIRRTYLQRGAFQPREHKFPQRNFYGKLRRFNPQWFSEYDWSEYSVTKNAAFCFFCYLSQDECINQGGGDSRKKSEDLMRQKQSIQSVLAKQSYQQKLEYRIRLQVVVDVIRYFLHQGLSFRGHREDELSLNRGNCIELLRWYTKRCDHVADAFKKAPKNNQLTSPYIQKDIITACKIETVKCIIEDLNNDHFSILIDESRYVSCKEQMAIVLQYVDRRGSVMERFIGIVHVRETTALCLKNGIVGLLAQHSLSPSSICGQCYNGASNMQGDINGLKILMQKESKGAHSIHYFAHQLQLTLVAVSKRCDKDFLWIPIINRKRKLPKNGALENM